MISPDIERKPSIMSNREAARVLLDFVHHSQGNSVLLRSMFEYAHIARPEWRIEACRISSVVGFARPYVYRLLNPDTSSSFWKKLKPTLLRPNRFEDVEIMLNGQVWMMATELNKSSELFPVRHESDIVAEMTYSLIYEDLYSLEHPLSLDNPNSLRHNYNFRIPNISYLYHFGFERNSTGNPLVDNVYQDVIRYINNIQSGVLPSSQLDELSLSSVARLEHLHKTPLSLAG